MTKSIVVVGAGVVGLTCAYQLAEEGYDVTIVAKHLPSTSIADSQYTSPWAGAHFRPFPAKTPEEYRDSKLTRSTFQVFKKLATTFPESSIRFMPGTDFIERDDPLYENVSAGYAEGIENFKVLPKSALPNGIKFGATYNAWCMNSPMYIQFLERRLEMYYKVKIVQESLGSLQQVAELFPGATIVNCSGRGLTYYGGYDPATYPIRGQTLLVKSPKDCPYNSETVTYQLEDGSFCFVIPRPLDGGVIVGGTKQVGDLYPQVRDADTQKLIENGKKWFPELLIDGEFQIKRINVGFRPARHGGVRIEREVVDGTEVVHCYGFGGSGYEMSWGAGQKVVELVKSAKSKL
ncbi:hypothetical protein KL918_003307 [Ogataea parapolymorpha]|uniref:D-aninoacid oxidase, FAD dependent oxidoreductase n=1 Tax=Ogataea parapolymorpha (strain ATCC 26012 / BCRC 20466 / JCM 22074 / NRRL Y-7560 / DL-1) TaxID=871575 RepID=W1Q6P2_OGAPD|nr:D-aninoacid oxidase, FAD dependent oxidoreductase [Ogataea parapolymorpha DL-1]ESW95748.1 D-aninoacid oxidase, FAD dependent oxidoreductase [Ogataea parapolymorpha DL-1]KAG7866410.1 hypothetical protein KL918_003307 [Ogataea parapolymorpha]KAG7872654.1 hypothetical protein KL916_003049 [Ogataea parapolymorpha]